MCLITREYIMGLENLQQFFGTTPSENPVIYYGVHISLATCLYLAFCDRAFEESSCRYTPLQHRKRQIMPC